MAHPKPDFTIKWGTLDEPIAPIADIDQNNGWSFLGNTPPTAAQFDYMMALYDKRDAWLEERATKAPSETDTAMLEIATQAETDAGTDDVRAVTPKKLRFGFSVNTGETGFIKFPSWMGGLIIQWGRNTGPTTGASGTESFSFPQPYGTRCLWLSGNEIASDPNGAASLFGRGANTTTTTAEIHWRKDSGSGFAGIGVYEWFSIGI